MKKTKRVYRRSAYGRVKGEITVKHGEIMDFGDGIHLQVRKGPTGKAVKMLIQAPRSVPIRRE